MKKYSKEFNKKIFKFQPMYHKNDIIFFNKENKSSQESLEQEAHYNKVSEEYKKNKSMHITKMYMKYISQEYKNIMPYDNFSNKLNLELACGNGELNEIYGIPINAYGLDISIKMLDIAAEKKENKNYNFIHSDALDLPFKNATIDNVFIIGGIHHIPDIGKLFREISRVLKKNGHLCFIEPLDDFFLWRFIRKIIYFISPLLDHKNEKPIRFNELNKELNTHGMFLQEWKTLGFIGFAFLMNSDILRFNKIIDHIPFRNTLINFLISFDKFFSKVPFFKRNGMVGIGKFKKL